MLLSFWSNLPWYRHWLDVCWSEGNVAHQADYHISKYLTLLSELRCPYNFPDWSRCYRRKLLTPVIASNPGMHSHRRTHVVLRFTKDAQLRLWRWDAFPVFWVNRPSSRPKVAEPGRAAQLKLSLWTRDGWMRKYWAVLFLSPITVANSSRYQFMFTDPVSGTWCRGCPPHPKGFAPSMSPPSPCLWEHLWNRRSQNEAIACL